MICRGCGLRTENCDCPKAARIKYIKQVVQGPGPIIRVNKCWPVGKPSPRPTPFNALGINPQFTVTVRGNCMRRDKSTKREKNR